MLRAGALAATLLAGRRLASATAPPPKETGLAFEGLLRGEPGFQPRRRAPLPRPEIPGLLSRAQLEHSYSVYRDAFASLLAAERALAAASRAPAGARVYSKLRRAQVEAANSVLLHEFYFRNLAPAAVKPPRYVLANLSEHMGSLESWREDFRACARVAEAWAVLVYDPYDDRWHNAALGRGDAGGWVGANPLVVCATAADAWSIGYKDKRDSYVSAFLDHIDWKVVAARYRTVDRH